MKVLRIKGLAAFIAITVLIFAAWFLLVDGALKKLIERSGTALVGARVELSKADLSISPLGITLSGLDVTDPDKPMENMVHVDEVSFLMDFKELLLGKIIINEMLLHGVKTGTARKVSGAIAKKEKKESKAEAKQKESSSSFALPSLTVPNIDDILKKEKLESIEGIERINNQLKEKEAAWKKKLAELPDEKKADDYNKRIREIKKGLKGKGVIVLKAVNDAAQLQKDIKRDLKNLKKAKKELKVDLKAMESDIKGLERLPQKDLDRLKKKYSLSSEGLGNFSKLLFAGKIVGWADYLMKWYKKAGPALDEMAAEKKKEKKKSRAEGENIKFREYKPQPDFLIKEAAVTLDIPAGLLKGEVRNITDNQPLTGNPTTLIFTGKNLKGLESTEIKGEINRLNAENPFEKGSVVTTGYKIKEALLSSNKDFPVQLKSALMDGNLNFIHKKEGLMGDFQGNFKATRFEGEAGKKGLSDIAVLLLSSLSDIQSFNVKGSLSRKERDYDVRLSSNIDRVMKKAIGQRVEKESKGFAEKLKSAIAKEISKPLNDLKKNSGGLENFDEILSGNLKNLENELKSSEKLSNKGFKLKL